VKKIKAISVKNLFGTLSYDIKIRKDTPTVLTAPNGAGKTHILEMLFSLLTGDLISLSSMPFDELRVIASDESGISVKRELLDGQPQLTLNATSQRHSIGKPVKISPDLLANDLYRELPPWLRRVRPGRWLDMRRDIYLNASQVHRIYGHSPISQLSAIEEREDLSEFLNGKVTLVDTKRLDAVATTGRGRASIDHMVDDPSEGEARIADYMRHLQSAIQSAQRESVAAAQKSDSQLVQRALDAASKTFRLEDLRHDYKQLQEHYQALAANTLAPGGALIPFPKRDTPTIRKIMGAFLEGYDERLEPLLQVNMKIQTLRDILDNKLNVSGKKTKMLSRGGLGFFSADGQRVRVEQLSSGEQHLVAIFTSLLFATDSESLVLIDEPEISLHMSWQHDFLDDISRIAEINSLQVIMATHSTAIVNGRDDLREALHMPHFTDNDSPQPVNLDVDEFEDDEL